MRPRSLAARLARLERKGILADPGRGLACLLRDPGPPVSLDTLRAMYQDPGIPEGEKVLLHLLFDYRPPPPIWEPQPAPDDEEGEAIRPEPQVDVAALADELAWRRAEEGDFHAPVAIPRPPEELVFTDGTLDLMPAPVIKIRNWRHR